MTDLTDLGLWGTLESNRGVRFEAWHTPKEGVLLGHDVSELQQLGVASPGGPHAAWHDRAQQLFVELPPRHVMGVQRRFFDGGILRAFARLDTSGRYDVESYDYDPDGSLSGIRSRSPGSWSRFYLQVVDAPRRRKTLTFAPRWAIEPTVMPDAAVDELEARLVTAYADRVIELIDTVHIDGPVRFVRLYGPPPVVHLSFGSDVHWAAAWRRRRYRAFDFYLLDTLDELSVDSAAFEGLRADYELLNQERTKRRQQTLLDGFTARVALELNGRARPAGWAAADDAIFVARTSLTRKENLRQIQASIPPDRFATIAESEHEAEQRHAAQPRVAPIAWRAAKGQLLATLRELGCDPTHPDPTSPQKALEAFARCAAAPIKRIDEEHEEMLFEAYSRANETTVAFTRQITRHDSDETYTGTETLSIELTFQTPTSEPTPAATLWRQNASWVDEIRATPAYNTFFDGHHTPRTINVSQGPV